MLHIAGCSESLALVASFPAPFSDNSHRVLITLVLLFYETKRQVSAVIIYSPQNYPVTISRDEEGK